MRDIEFWYVQAEKKKLARKQELLIETRLAYHGGPQDISDELMQIRWGLKSLDMDRRKMHKGDE